MKRRVAQNREMRLWKATSIRVLEKTGLRREGLLRSFVVYGERVGDAYLYAAVRGDI